MKILFKQIFFAASLLLGIPFSQMANSQNYLNHDGVNHTPSPAAFLVRAGTHAPISGFNWRYTFNQPASNWFHNSFSDASWATGRGSFARGGLQPGDASTNINWPSNQNGLWLRSTFAVSDPSLKHTLMFWGRWDDNIRIYINGVLAVDLFPNSAEDSMWSASYRYLGISNAARNSIVKGVNRIAVHVADTGDRAHLNLGLVKSYAMAMLPMTGYYKNNYFPGIISQVREQMSLYGVSAGSISIALDRNGIPDIFASAGIGYMTKDLSTRVPRHAVFRSASVDKPIARSAIRRFIVDGTPHPTNPNVNIALTTPIFPLINAFISKHGLPALTNANGLQDPIKNAITINEILENKSGIATIISPNGVDGEQVNVPDQGSILGNVRAIYRQPIQTRNFSGDHPYNNHAHTVLRYLVHLLAFEHGFGDYNDYIRHGLLEASVDKNIYVAWQDLNNRVRDSGNNLREPWYNLEHFFWPGEMLRNMLAGAFSTDAYLNYVVRIPDGEWWWWGGSQGANAFAHRGTYVDVSGRTRSYAFTLTFNSAFQPRADTDVIAIVNNAIRALPCTAWSPSGTVCQ